LPKLVGHVAPARPTQLPRACTGPLKIAATYPTLHNGPLPLSRRVAQVDFAKKQTGAFHPCHKLRRRSGRRCLCRPASRMTLAPNRPLLLRALRVLCGQPIPPTTTFVRASRQTTILVRASHRVPPLPSCVPENPRHTTRIARPTKLGGPSLAFL
jgi:hypothetical protein